MRRQCTGRLILLMLLLEFLPTTGFAQFDISDDAHQVFTLAPQLYPELFSDGSDLDTAEGYVYRYYSISGVYVGLQNDHLYLLGGPFGDDISSPGSVLDVRRMLEAEKTLRDASERAVLRQQVLMSWNAHGMEASGTPSLTSLPMRLSDVESITPLGLLAGGHVTPIDHIYFNPLDFHSAPATYEVFVTGDGLISEISTRRSHTGIGVEYRVVLQHSANFYSYYDLIDVLDPAIESQIPAGALEGGKIYRGPIRVNAGQVLGRIGGKTLDFANVDLNTFLPGFIRPSSYLREPWKLFTVDTFAAYGEPQRSQLLAKNKRLAEPRGGKIDFDVSGALRGNWFLQGTNGYSGAVSDNDGLGYWSGHLAIVPYVMDPDFYVVSLGNFKGQATQLGVREMPADPAKITPAYGVLKLELVQPPNGPPPVPSNAMSPMLGTILLQVLAGEKLRVEVFPDTHPSLVSGFTVNAKLYER